MRIDADRKEGLKEEIKNDRAVEQWIKKVWVLSTQAFVVFVIVWIGMTILNYIQIIQGEVPHKFILVVNVTIFITSISCFLWFKHIRLKRRWLNNELRGHPEN